MASPYYWANVSPGREVRQLQSVRRRSSPRLAAPGRVHQRTRLAPHVKPPPIPSIRTTWPGRLRPSPTASASANGVEAPDIRAGPSLVAQLVLASSPGLRP